MTNATQDIQKSAEAYYQQLVAKDPSLAGKPVTFQLTGSPISVGNGTQFPYPETENPLFPSANRGGKKPE